MCLFIYLFTLESVFIYLFQVHWIFIYLSVIYLFIYVLSQWFVYYLFTDFFIYFYLFIYWLIYLFISNWFVCLFILYLFSYFSQGQTVKLTENPVTQKKIQPKKKLKKWTPHKHKSRFSSTNTLLYNEKKPSLRSDYIFRGQFLFSAIYSINWWHILVTLKFKNVSQGSFHPATSFSI